MKPSQTIILEAQGLGKRFGAVVALEGVDLQLLEGEIHAVVGENGAGKSTLASILAGHERADGGEARLARGSVAMVHQHFKLVPAFTVEENLALPRLGSLAGPARAAFRAKAALALGDELGWSMDPRARVEALSVGTKQRLEVLKALVEDASVLVLDEPTASLSEEEVVDLFRVVRAVRDRGTAVLLIAHKVREVLAIADRVMVLKRGRVVASRLASELDSASLAQLMVGDLPDWVPNPARSTRDGLAAELGEGVFAIDRGEIVGFGGVDGNGQLELAEALAGVRAPEGVLTWRGGSFDGATVGYIPQDRQHDGLALRMDVRDNLLVGEGSSAFLLSPSATRLRALRLMERFDIRARSPEVPAGTLSGGNQQKIVVARVFDAEPDLLVAVNPTRGLDVRAARFVHDRLCEARERGAAIALFSSDLDELGALADRVYFLSKGRLFQGWDAGAVVGGHP